MGELLRTENDGSVSFGDYTLSEKKKVEDFPHAGDLLKVKTYCDITKLEKNGMFVYESVPGTTVKNFKENEGGVEFTVSGDKETQITLGLADDTVYEIEVDGESTGAVQTGLGGKLSVSVSLAAGKEVSVKVVKA
ncbi:MAG: endosialidase [Lachnospiraceae bacterium]|nr:endosialidase [Lachnospiraceae bacterium]